MLFWDVSFFVCTVSFVAWGIREGWRWESEATKWEKFSNIKRAPWGWVTWSLFAGAVISLVMGGNIGLLWRR